jgi:exodeoxyribonuclease III
VPNLLRLVTWNCYRGAAAARVNELESFEPTIVAIQECARPTDVEESKAWRGPNSRQGVFVRATSPYRIDPVKQEVPAEVFVPARVYGPVEFNIVGIWAQPSSTHPAYVTTLRLGVEALDHFIKAAPTVLIGDMNTARDLSARNAHMEFVEMLDAKYGLVSAYHAYFGCEHGKESHPTHYHRRKQEAAFHIDYCFIPKAWAKSIRKVEVGSFQEWGTRSDHTPLAVELAVPDRAPSNSV